MKATAKDLRFHSRELLDSVARGEEVVITYRGRPCARLVPIGRKRKANEDPNELFGVWKDNEKVRDVGRSVRDLRQGRS